MNIYTKTGDSGTSGLIGGTRVSKDDIRLEAYGCIDELNSFLGLLLTECKDQDDTGFVRKIQNQLFSIGSFLATDQAVSTLKILEPVTDEMIQAIESEIDHIVSLLPEIKQFVIPGGNKPAAICHICRTVCRRAERNVIKVSKVYTVQQNMIIYLNRLSDYLFVLARKACLSENKELFWENIK